MSILTWLLHTHLTNIETAFFGIPFNLPSNFIKRTNFQTLIGREMISVVIANSRLRGSEITAHFGEESIRYSSTIIPDLILNDCQPSLGAVIATGEELDPQNINVTVEKINYIQKYFKNACAIIIKECQNDWWVNFQSQIEAGALKLFLVESQQEASTVLMQLHEKLDSRNNESFRKQTVLFERIKGQNESYITACTIVRYCFEEMGIDDEDANTLLASYRSIARLLEEAGKPNRSTGTLDSHVMEAIRLFFYAPVPDSKYYYKSKFG